MHTPELTSYRFYSVFYRWMRLTQGPSKSRAFHAQHRRLAEQRSTTTDDSGVVNADASQRITPKRPEVGLAGETRPVLRRIGFDPRKRAPSIARDKKLSPPLHRTASVFSAHKPIDSKPESAQKWQHVLVTEEKVLKAIVAAQPNLLEQCPDVTVVLPTETGTPGLLTLVGSTSGLRSVRSILVDLANRITWPEHTGRDLVKVLERGSGPPTAPSEESRQLIEEYRSLGSEKELGQTLRNVLRALTHPAVLVTARHSAPQPGADGSHQVLDFRGATLSSFTAVTLGTNPFISFNIKTPSRTLDAFESTKELCIHILSATPAGAAIANAFTQPYEEAHEPFQLLKHAGASISGGSTGAPQLQFQNGVIAWLHARFDPSKQMQIVDHRVCFVAVRDVIPADGIEGWGQVALAYGRRSYTDGGSRIRPLKLPELNTQQAVSKAYDTSSERAVDAGNEPPMEEANPLQSISSDEPSSAIQTLQILNPNDVVDDEVTQQIQDSPSLVTVDEYFEAVSAVNREEPATLPSVSSATAPVQPVSGPESGQLPLTPPQAINGAPTRSTAKHTSQLAWGLPPTSQSFSTLCRPITKRLYTTLTRSSEISQQEDQDGSADANPNVLKQTVRDFLCHSDRRPVRRFNRLITLQIEAQKASKQLEKALADGSLDHEESERLENLITSNERFIARRLARNAAEDLREMLDDGHIAESRVQYIEACVEKGRAVLIEVAQELRKTWDAGHMLRDEFQRTRQALEKEDEVLRIELMRLKDMVEDDEQEPWDDD